MRATSILVLLVLTALPAAAQEPPPSSDAVSLSFAWEPGLEASVRSTKSRTRVTDKKTQSSATLLYTLRAERQGEDGLRIRSVDPRPEPTVDAAPLAQVDQIKAFFEVTDFTPDFLVSKEGEFAGIDELPAFQARLQKLLGDLLSKGADTELAANLTQLLTSEQVLDGRAAEQWNAIVGTWLEAEFEIGETYTHSIKQPVPIVPGQEIVMNLAFSAKQRVPCLRGGVSRQCVELEMRATADPDDVARMIQSFMDKLDPKKAAGTLAFQSLDLENVVTVVTEPNGLVPHSCTLTRTLHATILDAGKEKPVEQVDETRVVYTYP